MYKCIFSLTSAAAIFGLLGTIGVAQQTPVHQAVRHVDAADSIPVDSVPTAGTTVYAPSTLVGVHPEASAPPLTRVFVNNVCSDSVGSTCETIKSGQLATTNVYTGANVYVFVWEIGYGQGEMANQGGFRLTNSQLVAYDGVCQSGSSYTTNCPVGSVYVGWRYEWNSGYYLNLGYGTNFTAQDTSINYPYNTYAANLTIRYSK